MSKVTKVFWEVTPTFYSGWLLYSSIIHKSFETSWSNMFDFITGLFLLSLVVARSYLKEKNND